MSEELAIESENKMKAIVCGDRSNYELIKKIGKGKYGEVFEAFNVTNNKRCAVKVLKAVKHEKIQREINILTRVSGGPNIIKLRDVLCDEHCLPALVFHFASDYTLKDVMTDLTENEAKFYLFKLLRALEFTHSQGIIHRDVKPSNVMVDRSRKLLRLIDWGLADLLSNQESFSVCVASRFYKSPELLLGNKYYDYSLDLWSFGCILAAVLFVREPFFCGTDNNNQLIKIINVIGSKQLKAYAEKHRSALPTANRQFVRDIGITERKSWQSIAILDDRFKHLINDTASDLMDGLLKYEQRLTASQAINHPFFDTIRQHFKM